MPLASRSFALVLIAAVAMTTSGCGRRGDLDTPYQANKDAREAAEDAGTTPPPAREPYPADRKFILDGLI